MASEQDYYRILGVPTDASTPEIRRAYRRLALEHHPDRNPLPDSPARFRELTSAYGVLSDPAERAGYDRATNLNLGDQAPMQPTRPRVRGVLELSEREAQLAYTGRLVLSDQRGLTITLPPGARAGDTVVFKLGGQTVVLTIRVSRR